MERHDQQQLREISDEVAGWVAQATTITDHRAKIEQTANCAVDALRHSVVEIHRDGTPAWRVIPLRRTDGTRLGDVARRTHLIPLTEDDQQVLKRLVTDAAAATHDVRSSLGVRRFFRGSKKRDAGRAAADFLVAFWEWASGAGVPALLTQLSGQSASPSEIATSEALAEWVGLAPHLNDLGNSPEVVAAAAVADLPDAVATIERALGDEANSRSRAVNAGNEVRAAETRALVVEMPVERLKEATRDRLLIGPLTEAGIRTVQEVLDLGAGLEHLPRIGATTATRIRGAAHTLWQTTYDEMPARIDIKNRTEPTTQLLRSLAAWDATRKIKGATTDLARTEELSALARAIDRNVHHLLVIVAGSEPVSSLHDDVATVVRRARLLSGTTSATGSADPWDDFLARPADYFAMLAELGFITEDEQKTHGDLPEDIIDAVRALELDTEHLSASLRGYQSFAARFALVQRKVIIGDEMGLGKTVEAIAVLAHLRSKGSHHTVVICPAAVVTNWVREVSSKSQLRPHRAHGPARDAAVRSWIRNGGVAVTTFESLAWFEQHTEAVSELSCIVVDEAHYIKNPDALRTQRATRLLDSADRAILLTGTPLENRIDEFRNLVGYLRPDLVIDANELSAGRFRRQVAPAYLRRNTEDVLTELPDLVEVEEWLPMSTDDAAAYRDAVSSGNFMKMRQVAMLHGQRSAKIQRLVEIVEEAEDNGRRVIVFSHFRDVLDEVVRALPGQVFGPLTGSVPAAARQTMVDQFSAAGHGAVLVSQIVAGGVGLNIQAASVVVICEPQLKPTTEWQAIARARRMGQLESVQVHRLLSEEGVDQRITTILERKRELFDEFARVSDTAESAPEAFDVSEADLARDIIAAERQRLSVNTPKP
ncbi:DEAD/DEAH box helicase [Rhodococcus sp. NCIMB 12038]|uniref:DEAD/DEAH box helicase n=1 Tax=Rhodococcus sp. NCIMB 12038 TaxID=933800 RepID=UPI000B3D11A6|nr:DEAD/DEAH box helicase [Rhodococcus sp. NCIMB 12038]OUS97320.1 helicase SNF2 [Rhodococcus sp. NCIMB 12038]